MDALVCDVERHRTVRHSCRMDETTHPYEEAARIVEAYAEAEDDVRVIELLSDIARDIRAQLASD